ncbi:uncharacterized protein LOC127788771 isoform X5 [Diospyros lotus]|uniref:uncharacterized protein LOC127788771 isoform X5 n=1 Tax=Diospyros lotus TaxID=55363 RepID=UPI00224D517A|nr:uncharacterized protein LOC127788771 isoform X5 [Diospyros lotus]
MCDSVSSVTLPLLSYSAIGSSNSRFSTSNCMPPGARSLQVFSCSSDRNGGCRLTGACFRWDGAGPNTAKSASSLKASRNPIPSGSSEYDLYGKLGFKEKEKEEIGLGTEQRIEKQKRGSEIDQFSVNFVEFNEETGANSVERLEDEDLVKTEEGNDGFDSKLEECEQSDVIKGPIATRKGRQVMRRSNLVAKQVIGLQSALSLGFVSQLWVDTVSWLALVVEVRPTLFSGEVDRFFLEDVSQVGDVVLIHDDCLMENELQIVGLETLDQRTGRTIGTGLESHGLYYLSSPTSSVVCTTTTSPLQVHCRLGHPSLPNLKKMVPSHSRISSLECESCQLRKHSRSSFPSTVNKRVSSPFLVVH